MEMWTLFKIMSFEKFSNNECCFVKLIFAFEMMTF